MDIVAFKAQYGDAVRVWDVGADDPDAVLAQALGLVEEAAVIRPDAHLGLVVDGPGFSGSVAAWLADYLHLYLASPR